MSLLNQFYVVPMVKAVRPNPACNLMHRRRPWMEVDGLLDEVFGDFFDLATSNYYGGNQMTTTDKSDKNFRVQLDVSQFTPDEIKVRVVGRDLVIDGKHEERQDDHGYISRSFTRRYALPDDVNEDKVACQLSKDGKLLKLEVPRKDAIEDSPKERVIAIQNEPADDTIGAITEDATGSDTKKDETGSDSKTGA